MWGVFVTICFLCLYPFVFSFVNMLLIDCVCSFVCLLVCLFVFQCVDLCVFQEGRGKRDESLLLLLCFLVLYIVCVILKGPPFCFGVMCVLFYLVHLFVPCCVPFL